MKAAPTSVRPSPQRRYRSERLAFCLTAMGVRVQAGADGSAAYSFWRPSRCTSPSCSYGPFVMNTREEIEQALADYRNGHFRCRGLNLAWGS